MDQNSTQPITNNGTETAFKNNSYGNNETVSANALFSLPYSGKILIYLCFSIIIMVGTTGNAMVIYVVGIKHKLVRTYDIHIVALAITDFYASIFIPLVSIHDIITNFESWQLLGVIGCKLLVPLNQITVLVSALILVAISVSRLRVIRRTTITQHSKTRSLLQIALIIVISLATVTPLINAYTYEYEICWDRWADELDKDMYYRFIYHTCFQVIGCFLPICVMVVVYSMSIYILKKRIVPGNNQRMLKKRQKQNMHIIKMFGTVVTIFFLLTVPYMIEVEIYNYYLLYKRQVYYENINLFYKVNYGLYTMFSFNCCVNPFIYASMNKNVKRFVRQHVRNLTRCWKKTSVAHVTVTSEILDVNDKFTSFINISYVTHNEA